MSHTLFLNIFFTMKKSIVEVYYLLCSYIFIVLFLKVYFDEEVYIIIYIQMRI